MTYKREGKEGERSIRLQIIGQPSGGKDNFKDGASFFEPQREPSDPTPTIRIDPNSTSRNGNYSDQAPEKKLTLFALRLAILEKTATGLGKLGFVWATVVLLGGFAATLEPKDFWFVTVILIIESTRIFSRSHELEWQHRSTWSLKEAGQNSFRALISSSRHLLQAFKAIFRVFPVIIKSDSTHHRHIAEDIQTLTRSQRAQITKATAKRTWRTTEVPLLPYAGRVFSSKNISSAFHWLQILSAIACVTLSLLRLSNQSFGEVLAESRNGKAALDIFYSLALSEALTFLMEKAYWEWKVTYGKILQKVCQECNFGPSGLVLIKRFFYDAYSSCICGSIFDGLKMDLISFAEELLESDSHDEQLMGAQMLENFVISQRSAAETLRKIGTSNPVIERLIDMLTWKTLSEEQIRKSAAVIVSKLASKKQNALRVAGIPGAIEAISSLLYTGRGSDVKPFDIWDRNLVADQTDYEFSIFNLLGLLILKKLAYDHDNCWKIGSARGLLSKIIDFTSADERLLTNEQATESQIKAVKRSLQLVRMLVSTTGHTGKMLRQEIADVVFTVSNMREILEHGGKHMILQILAIEIITGLAMDEEAREKIGRTGRVIKLLLSISCNPGVTDEQNSVRIEASEALAMLALESKTNCGRILKEGNVVERLVEALQDPVVRINSARILRNLCAYSGDDGAYQLKAVITSAPKVLHSIMTAEEKPLEVSIGLATQIFKFMSAEEYADELERVGISETDFVKRLVQILEKYNKPHIKVPRIRRYTIELASWMMKVNGTYIQIFNKFEMEKVLNCVAETTSELECYNAFSGSVGLSQQNVSVYSLVEAALALISRG